MSIHSALRDSARSRWSVWLLRSQTRSITPPGSACASCRSRQTNCCAREPHELQASRLRGTSSQSFGARHDKFRRLFSPTRRSGGSTKSGREPAARRLLHTRGRTQRPLDVRASTARAMTARTALITGASRGIGREVARTLASEGWHVLSGVRVPKSAPPGTEAEAIDMADRESIEALAKRLRARDQRLDAFVNNAGVYEGNTRHIWDVNVLGPLLLTTALEPLLTTNACG